MPENCDIEIEHVIDSYFEFRGYKEPDREHAFLFLVTEMAEVAEVLLHEMYDDRPADMLKTVLDVIVLAGYTAEDYVAKTDGWVRNNPGAKHFDGLEAEIGDVLMMLYKFAQKSGVYPYTAMLSKMKKKGF